MDFADLLRRERAQRGFTQEQLAEAAGLTSRSIRSLETGAARPRRSTVELLCTALDLPPGGRQEVLRSCGYASGPPGGSAADTTAPAQLLRDIPDFVGRREVLEELRALLLAAAESGGPADTPAIIAINGLGGMGKTALAVHLAHRVRTAFGDGQLFVDLDGGSENPRDPDSVLGSLLRDLGVPGARIPADPASKSALLRSVSTERRILFVLDNAHDTAQVRPLLPSSPGCAVLITSRKHLAALDGVVHRTLGPLSAAEAQTLLTSVASPAQEGDRPAMTRIVDFCAGLPLAVRIAAARLAAPSQPGAPAFAEQLSQVAQRLDGLAVEDLSVRSTLAASIALLDMADEADRTAMRALGFLCGWPGGATGPQCTAAALNIPVAQSRQALAHLADTSLLETRSSARYVPHDLVKLLIREQTPADPGTVSAAFDWYSHAMDRAVASFAGYFTRPELPGPPPAELPRFTSAASALRWCEDEYDNVAALIRYGAAAGWDERTSRLAILAMPFGEQRMRLRQWIDCHQAGLACAGRAGERILEGRCHSGLAAAYRWTGEFSVAMAHSSAALSIFTELGDRERIGVALVTRARIPYATQDYPAAVAGFRDAVAFLRQGAEPVWLASALNQLGMALSRTGDPGSAVPHQLESIRIADAAGLKHTVATSLLNLSISYAQLGKLPEAASAIERAAASVAGLPDVVLQAEILRQLGEVRDAQGGGDEAARLFRRALAMMDDVGYPEADNLRQRLSVLTGAC